MKKMFLFVISILLSFFVCYTSPNAVTKCEYSLKNMNSYWLSKNTNSYSLSNNSSRTIHNDIKLVMSLSDDYHDGDAKTQDDANVTFGVKSPDPNEPIKVHIGDSSSQWDTYSAYNDLTNVPDGYGYDALNEAKKCNNLNIIYYNSGNDYYIINVGFDKYGSLADSKDDMSLIFEGRTFPTGKEVIIANVSSINDNPGGVTTCEYSLAYIPNSIVNIGNNSTYSLSDNTPTVLKADSKLYMDINNSYVDDKSNVSFRTTSDGSFSIDYLHGKEDTIFSAGRDMTDINTSDRQKKINLVKKCPDLSILYYKQKYANTYRIINVAFKNTLEPEESLLYSSKNDETLLNELTVVLEGGSVPQTEGIMLGTIKQYNESSNSIDTIPEIATYCEEHPESSYCKLLSKFSGGKDLDTSSFSFCDSKGVLKTLRIVHIVTIIIKVMVPIILIGTGSVIFVKAMLSDDEKSIAKAGQKFIFSIVVSVIVFLIPTIVNAIIGMVKKDDSSFSTCQTCLSGSISSCNDVIENAGGE